MIKVLGRGSFGKVMLVEKIDSSLIYWKWIYSFFRKIICYEDFKKSRNKKEKLVSTYIIGKSYFKKYLITFFSITSLCVLNNR